MRTGLLVKVFFACAFVYLFACLKDFHLPFNGFFLNSSLPLFTTVRSCSYLESSL